LQKKVKEYKVENIQLKEKLKKRDKIENLKDDQNNKNFLLLNYKISQLKSELNQ